MDRKKLKKTKKDKLVLLARKSNIRGATMMTKERLVDTLMRLSSKKVRVKKAVKARAKAQKVISRIKTLPQYRFAPPQREQLKEKLVPSHPIQQQHVEKAKYYLGPTPEYRKPEEFNFPAGYGDNKIIIMVRDPWWIYSYWEISQHKEGEVRDKINRKGLSPVKSILRIYDVTDIDFNGRNSHNSFDIDLHGLANTWYINVGSPNRSWVVDIGILANNGEFFLLARSNCVRTPRFGMSDVIDEEWMCLEDDYWKMFGLSGGFGLGKASLAMKEMFKKRLMEQVTSGAVSSLFSPAKKKPGKKGFWLWVDAELVVYGQTEPDAKLTVQKKPIRLREDGTFSLRFALPDGRQEISVSATSSNGDDIKVITPIVTRRTD